MAWPFFVDGDSVEGCFLLDCCDVFGAVVALEEDGLVACDFCAGEPDVAGSCVVSGSELWGEAPVGFDDGIMVLTGAHFCVVCECFSYFSLDILGCFSEDFCVEAEYFSVVGCVCGFGGGGHWCSFCVLRLSVESGEVEEMLRCFLAHVADVGVAEEDYGVHGDKENDEEWCDTRRFGGAVVFASAGG